MPTQTRTQDASSPATPGPADIKALMISHLDNSGISRVKVVPGGRLSSVARSGTSVSLSLGMLFSWDDHVSVTDAIDPTIGDLRGVPDLDALALIDPGAGLYWAPADLHDMTGNAHPTCQRSTLKRIDARAEEQGYSFLVGIELEFTLYRGDKESPELAHDGPGYGTLAFLELEQWSLDVIAALQTAGVPIEQFHPEYESGQMEVSFAPLPAVQAVDAYVLARLVIARIALKHGFRASFAPVTEVGKVANGCHIHLSATKNGSNVFYDTATDHGISEEGGQMIAGVLEHLSDGLVLLGGSVLSFDRLQPHNWAGAYSCWGAGNREAAVRYMGGFHGYGASQANIEVKCADPAANHYLAVAALIGSALDGVRRQLPLPAGIRVDPSTLTDTERARARVERFPENLGAALERFARSRFYKELLGDMLFSSYLEVHTYEWETYGDTDRGELAERVRWRY